MDTESQSKIVSTTKMLDDKECADSASMLTGLNRHKEPSGSFSASSVVSMLTAYDPSVLRKYSESHKPKLGEWFIGMDKNDASVVFINRILGIRNDIYPVIMPDGRENAVLTHTVTTYYLINPDDSHEPTKIEESDFFGLNMDCAPISVEMTPDSYSMLCRMFNTIRSMESELNTIRQKLDDNNPVVITKQTWTALVNRLETLENKLYSNQQTE